MLKIYLMQAGELIPDSLQTADYLDAVTPSIPAEAVIADADLPEQHGKSAYIVEGERNDDGHYTVSQNVRVVADHRGERYYDRDGEGHEIMTLGEAIPRGAVKQPRPSNYHKLIRGKWVLNKTAAAQQLVDTAQQQAALVDNTVADIYQHFTRFAQEYELREAQALAFKKADYKGAIPEQVAAFATPAGISGKQAADIIIAKGAQLRAALASIGAVRMKKEAFKHQKTVDDIMRLSSALLDDIKTMAARLS